MILNKRKDVAVSSSLAGIGGLCFCCSADGWVIFCALVCVVWVANCDVRADLVANAGSGGVAIAICCIGNFATERTANRRSAS